MSRFKNFLSRLVTPVSASDEERLKELIRAEASHYLTDIEWRYAQARDLLTEAGSPRGAGSSRRATAEDLNILQHVLTGYTVTANTNASGVTTPGWIRWQSLHIVYAGVDYTVADGATNMKYTYFVKPGSGTTVTLTSSDTKPTLGPDDILVFINNAGTPTVPAQGQGSLPQAVADGTVDQGALLDGAVAGNKIANNGIGAGKLGTGAINAATQFASGVVDSTALGGNAVTAGKIANGAINGAGLFSGKILTNAQIVDGTVNTALLAGNAVDNTKLADNAVSGTKIANGGVGAGKLATGAISAATMFAGGIVDTAALGAGAVQPSKLNILTHVLY